MNQYIQVLIRRGVVAVSLLVVASLLSHAQAASLDKSDLNGDYTVDIIDLQIFSTDYLLQDWQTVNWCNFYQSSLNNEKFFRDATSEKTESFDSLLKFIADAYNCQVIVATTDKSDLNNDRVIDTADLTIFSSNYLERYWESVDWCLFHENTLAGLDFEGRRTGYYLKHFGLLLSFINDYFGCGGSEPPPFAIQLENVPKKPVRIAHAANFSDDYYVTDHSVGSLFIYDANLVLKGEIKGLNKPLGVAVDSQGYVLVGNDGRNNIEVYNPANGDLVAVFGEGLLKMPTAITLDALGNIYVTDSLSHGIQVFDAAYNPVRVIGKSDARGALNFPLDSVVINRSDDGVANIEEIFVADQTNKRIQVYDLAGNWLRSFTFAGTDGIGCSWFTGVCDIPGAPPFTKVQALDVDSQGRLHVLDNHAAAVVMFDPADGTFLGSYGGYGTDGTGAGYLRLPMDVLVSATDALTDIAIVISGDGRRIEVFTNP